MNELQIIEKGLVTIADNLAAVLPQTLPAEKLIRTVMIACENNPAVGKCSMPSILRSAMSAAVLGLEVDGVSGQGYLVPFKGNAQFIVGYRGLCTIADRAKWTLDAFVVHEGDAFEFDEPSGYVKPGRKLGNEDAPIVAAYALARHNSIPPKLRVMSLKQIVDVRDRSAGWKARRERSTWGTEFAAMARKTPLRMLAKDMPVLALHLASSLETQHDLGRVANVEPDGFVTVDAAGSDHTPVAGPDVGATDAEFVINKSDGSKQIYSDVHAWVAGIDKVMTAVGRDTARLAEWWDRNQTEVEEHIEKYPDDAGRIIDKVLAMLS